LHPDPEVKWAFVCFFSLFTKRMTVVTDELYGRICALREINLPFSKISAVVKLSENVCRYGVTKGVCPSACERQPGCSKRAQLRRRRVKDLATRKQVRVGVAFTPKRKKQKERRFVVRPYQSPREIAAGMNKVFKTKVSTSTIRRDLLTEGFKARKRRKVSFLSDKGKQYRVEFAEWGVEEDPAVMFSDEKEFNTNEDCNKWEWLQPGERPSGARGERACNKVGVWGCICPDGSFIVRVYEKQNLDRQAYRKILASSLKELQCQSKKGVVFMQDGARPHCGALEWLRRRGVKTLEADWPANSSDLNPIEQVWSIVDRKVKETCPYGVEELVKAIHSAASSVPKSTIMKLVRSFPKRCEKVVASKGDFIKP